MGEPQFVAERFGFTKPKSIDREKGFVYGVRVLNTESRNDRVYPEAVSARAVEMYTAPCNIGHHFDPKTMLPLEPDPLKRFGRHLNPRAEAGGIVTDFRYNVEHEFAKPFGWAVENDPESLCFSHLARVQWQQKRDGKNRLVAESILEVASVDVVCDGGTTSGVFESYFRKQPKWTAEMLDPEKIVSELETDGAMIAFLTDLFAKLKPSSQSTKDMVISLVTAAMSGAAEPPADEATDAAAIAPAMESLRRFGPVGKWAAKRLDALFVAEAAKKRETWAQSFIKAAQVPDAAVTPLFVTLVAESMGNDARAKELCDERKQLPVYTGKRDAITSDRASGAKSVADLTAGYVTG